MSPQRALSHSQRRGPTISQAILLISLLVVCAVGIMSSAAQSTQDNAASSSKAERELVDTIPKHLPIKVKIKKEKEKAFKDLKNEKWVRDFELEVTNTGDKPIYFLSLLLDLPEITAPDGIGIAFSIHYGRKELGYIETKAGPDDVPIKPGETYVFSFPDRKLLDWERFRQRENKPDAKKLILLFQILSFGDGTGFVGNGGMAVPHAPDESRA
jgi:hypothetical protein